MSANSQYQLALSPSTNTTALQITSTFGQSWTTLTGATGLPSATSYTAGAVSGNGQYAALGAYGGYLYTTANAGQTWTNTNPNTGSLYAQLAFEGNTNDISGNGRTVNAFGSSGYVTGIVGTRAINLVNASGATATQYIRISWPGATNFTFSGWFNMQSFLSPQYARIVNAYSNGVYMTVRPDASLYCAFASGGGTSLVAIEYGKIALNTWYNYTIIFQTNALCSFYINNRVVGTITNTSGLGTFTSENISLGCIDISTGDAFNGYMDDFKVYNSAITFTPMVPQNWSNVALSNSGQYMLATATGAGLYLSSNYGSTWIQVTSAMINAIWSSAQVSATGQYMLAYSMPQMVQPQLSGLASSTTNLTTSPWQTSGITWIASASSVLSSSRPVSGLFDNIYNPSWANSLQVYISGGNSSSFTTNIIGVTQTPYTTGDWVQIQSSVPLVMHSYQFANGFTTYQTPKIFYIAGSIDGINWYPIQRAEITGGGTTGTGSQYTLIPGTILVNSTAAQTFGSITLTGTAYATTTNAYTYFRLIFTSIFTSVADYVSLGEWVINFQAGGQTYSTNYGANWNNSLPFYTTIQPQLPGLASSTTNLTTSPWQTGGITWIASTSSTLSGYPVSAAFDSTYSTWWACSAANVSYTTGGNNTTATPTTVIGVGSLRGDWIQIQSSLPLVMYSYQLGNPGGSQMQKSFHIVGSNDGTNWYPIQSATIAAIPGPAQTLIAGVILVNSSATQQIGTSTLTGTAYATTTNAYTYFRMICISNFNSVADYVSINEWVINFAGSTSSTQALSGSGQYQLTSNTTIPPTLLSQLTFDGTAPAAYADSVAGGLTNPIIVGSGITISNTAKVGSNSLSITGTAGTNGSNTYISYTLPLFFAAFPNTFSISAWIYPTALPSPNTAAPIQLGAPVGGATLLDMHITPGGLVGLEFFTTVGNLSTQKTLITTTAITINTWTHIAGVIANGIAYLYVNGLLQSSTTYTGVPCNQTTAVAATSMIVGCVAGLFNQYTGYIDNIRIYNAGLTSTQIYTLYATTTLTPAIYITQNFSLSGIITPTITPAITATNIPVSSAISTTGQYMVFVTNSTSGNNVYYSSNYGATFTSFLIGTALTSCAISYDGSYITVSNATNVWTLNNNSSGYSVAVGNQAGQQNQAVNAIAIGNYAGTINQTANSIILNASGQGLLGTGLNSYAPGFYVAPIASYTASSSQSFALLGYGIGTGADNQVVQNANITMTGNLLTINGSITSNVIASSYINTTGGQALGGIFFTGDIPGAQWQISGIGSYRLGFNINNTGIGGYNSNYTPMIYFDQNGTGTFRGGIVAGGLIATNTYQLTVTAQYTNIFSAFGTNSIYLVTVNATNWGASGGNTVSLSGYVAWNNSQPSYATIYGVVSSDANINLYRSNYTVQLGVANSSYYLIYNINILRLQ
jgi:hypothetical protein